MFGEPQGVQRMKKEDFVRVLAQAEGKRRVWRFRLSALADAMGDRMVRRRGGHDCCEQSSVDALNERKWQAADVSTFSSHSSTHNCRLP